METISTVKGQWKWREDELSLKQFRELSIDERDEYIFLLKGLKPEILGTNDEYILRWYNQEQIPTSKFLEL
jgi:hypothetical protein